MAPNTTSLNQALRRWSRLSSWQGPDFCLYKLSSFPRQLLAQSVQTQPRKRPLSPQCLYIRQQQQQGQQYQHQQQSRLFSLSLSRPARTVQQARALNRTGPFTLKSALIFCGTGAAMIFYFRYEKARLERKRTVEMSKGYGKPKVGGPFTLKDLDGNAFTEKNLLGKYTMIYFGFTHCPDICPDELDKMSSAIDIIQSRAPNTLRPIFVSCDPARDTPSVLRSYLSEFHPSLIGLSGTWDQTKNMCKQYRVYFSTPPDVKPNEEDYLVDHSIYFYVMDPEGDFVECIGRQDTPESAAGIVLQHVRDWKSDKKPIDETPLPYLREGGREKALEQAKPQAEGGVVRAAA